LCPFVIHAVLLVRQDIATPRPTAWMFPSTAGNVPHLVFCLNRRNRCGELCPQVVSRASYRVETGRLWLPSSQRKLASRTAPSCEPWGTGRSRWCGAPPATPSCSLRTPPQ
jgi:hypothetical protein